MLPEEEYRALLPCLIGWVQISMIWKLLVQLSQQLESWVCGKLLVLLLDRSSSLKTVRQSTNGLKAAAAFAATYHSQDSANITA